MLKRQILKDLKNGFSEEQLTEIYGTPAITEIKDEIDNKSNRLEKELSVINELPEEDCFHNIDDAEFDQAIEDFTKALLDMSDKHNNPPKKAETNKNIEINL